MRGNYIDFISAYCDRWCERCAFTDRCSAYAVEIAEGMCEGDFEAAIELALGAPPPMNEAETRERERFLAELANEEPTEEEIAEEQREQEQRRDRLDELPLTTTCKTVLMLTRRWLDDRREDTAGRADPVLADALAVAAWDSYFIHAKVHRAMRGRDAAQHGEDLGDDHPIQNDWNGSAKVALISTDRSIRAWDVIASATGDLDAAQVARELGRLRGEVEQAFPNARKFVRPGFDR